MVHGIKEGMSQLGVGAVTELETGLIVDFEVISKYCSKCAIQNNKKLILGQEHDAWKKKHSPGCHINHEGSSGSMEVVAATPLFEKSQPYNMRCMNLVSHGDSATYKAITDLN